MLAGYYAQHGQPEKAAPLYQQIRTSFPDAVNHSGRPLVDRIPQPDAAHTTTAVQP